MGLTQWTNFVQIKRAWPRLLLITSWLFQNSFIKSPLVPFSSFCDWMTAIICMSPQSEGQVETLVSKTAVHSLKSEDSKECFSVQLVCDTLLTHVSRPVKCDSLWSWRSLGQYSIVILILCPLGVLDRLFGTLGRIKSNSMFPSNLTPHNWILESNTVFLFKVDRTNLGWSEYSLQTNKTVRTQRPISNWKQSLPFQQLQVLWTLFSESFASFPCGTCALSVSHQYLALGGVYHQI